MGVREIMAFIDEGNEKSRRVAEKVGLVRWQGDVYGTSSPRVGEEDARIKGVVYLLPGMVWKSQGDLDLS